MLGNIRLGSVLGIEIRLDYSWFLVLALMTWSLATGVFPVLYGMGRAESWGLGAAAALLLFGCVLVHELAHGLAARREGIETEAITLFLLGGVAQIAGEPPSPGVEARIAAAGPFASVVLGLAGLGAAASLPDRPALLPLQALFHYVGMLNLALALFNLVPALPLDGGRLLRSALWHCTGSLQRATAWAAAGGRLFGWSMIALGLCRTLQGDVAALWLTLIGSFLNGAARAAHQQTVLRGALSGLSVADVMTREVPAVDAELRVPQFIEGYLLCGPHATYPVIREGELVGLISAEDVRRLEPQYWGVTCVGALARCAEEERLVQDDQDAWDAVSRMLETDAPRLLVLHGERLRGIVCREAVLRRARRRQVA
jgi:Zn-dependent protease/CBS domain-containing protein